MQHVLHIIIYLAGFILILFASEYFSRIFQRFNLPFITGLLFTGLLCSSQVLNLISAGMLENLDFLNEISLAFIAFAVGAELFLKEIRTRISNITRNAAGLITVTYLLGLLSIFFITGLLAYTKNLAGYERLAISLLLATVFLASSPSTVMAVINEIRAKGTFTGSALAVTMIKDVVVIILFTLSISISLTIVSNDAFSGKIIFLILFELALTFLAGYLAGRWLGAVLNLRISGIFKTSLIILSGYSIIRGAHLLRDISHEFLSVEIYLEPLLVCVSAGFYVINYSKNRLEFQKIINETLPIIFIIFFTMTGAGIDLRMLFSVGLISIGLFLLRILVLFIGATAGSFLAGDPPSFRLRNWMPYVTQGAIALGLVNEITGQFSNWGTILGTIVTGSIILNLLAGPWLFRKSLLMLKEGKVPDKTSELRDRGQVIIFGLEDQSIALARQLNKHDMSVKIITAGNRERQSSRDLNISPVKDFSPGSLRKVEFSMTSVAVLLLKDIENYHLCKWLTNRMDSSHIVVRLHNRELLNDFMALKVHVLDQSTAILNLLVHFVQSPMAATLILGDHSTEDIADVVVSNPELHGILLRNLRIPVNVIIISVRRSGQTIISHGYTRLRLGDEITIAGKIRDIRKMKLLFSS